MRLLNDLTVDHCHLLDRGPLDAAALLSILPASSAETRALLLASADNPIPGSGFLLLHARVAALEAPQVDAVQLPQGSFAFVFLTPSVPGEIGLQLLAHFTWLAAQPGLGESLESATSPASILAAIASREATAQGGFGNLDRQEVFRELDSGPGGLDQAEADHRLALGGPNRLGAARKDPAWLLFGRNLVSIFALLLWLAGALCFLPGLAMPQLGWAIFTVVVVNAVFAFWQEQKAGRAVEVLQDLIPRETAVRRGGVVARRPAAELVWGDIIELSEGDLVPADARLIEAESLQVNNASLTGESRPVYLMAEPLPVDAGRGYLWTELPNMVFAGTTIQSGSGVAIVIGTGMGTEIGKIAHLTQTVKRQPSPLQKEIKTLVNVLTAVSLGIGLVFFLVGRLWGGLTTLGAFIFTIGITVANIPEGLLPTVSLSLAMGVQRLARRGVLVKQLASVETLGSTAVICTDKTGTLTTNRISVVALWLPTGVQTVEPGKPPVSDPGLARLLEVAVLCNNAHLAQGSGQAVGDPTETALLALAAQAGIDPETFRVTWTRLVQYPFDSVRKRMGTAHRDPAGGAWALVKGAPVELMACCATIRDGEAVRPITAADRTGIATAIDTMARTGLRTLAFAHKPLSDGAEPPIREELEQGLCFLGFCGMEDPPRPEVTAAIASCRTAGIRVVMVTGDYGLTARAIAMQIGLCTEAVPGTHLSGSELERLDDAALDAVLSADAAPLIFSRLDPTQKMRIVARFKALGQVVAVTGDGVNDAAALKLADIGIAMGLNVSDVAREAAAMVILDGNFASIVAAIAEGRAVYANIRRFVTYVLTSNMPELAPFVLFVLCRLPLALGVMQILAIDLGTDLVPALGLGVEAPEPGLMDRPPRRARQHLIDLALGLRAYLWLGGWEIGLSLCAYFKAFLDHGWKWGQSLATTGPVYTLATTMTLAGIVACQIGTVLACRSARSSVFAVGVFRNSLVWGGIAVELLLLVGLVYIPFFQEIFGLVPLEPRDWLFLALFPPILLGVEELRKAFMRRIG